LEVRDALRALNAEAEGYRIQKLALELAEDRLEAQKMLLDVGQSNVRLLLESEGDLLPHKTVLYVLSWSTLLQD
jgi:outer membrane protein TolC